MAYYGNQTEKAYYHSCTYNQFIDIGKSLIKENSCDLETLFSRYKALKLKEFDQIEQNGGAEYRCDKAATLQNQIAKNKITFH